MKDLLLAAAVLAFVGFSIWMMATHPCDMPARYLTARQIQACFTSPLPADAGPKVPMP